MVIIFKITKNLSHIVRNQACSKQLIKKYEDIQSLMSREKNFQKVVC